MSGFDHSRVTGHKMTTDVPWRVVAAVAAAAAFLLGSLESIELLGLPGACFFGVLVRRAWALLLAFVPFLLDLFQDAGGGDPPGWVAGLFFEVPLLCLVIGSGVLAGRLVERRRNKGVISG